MNNIIKSFIFLDIDGPINTERNKRYQSRIGRPTSSYKIRLPKEQILNLRNIVYSTKNTNIVLSSSWRLGGIPSKARENLESQLRYYGLDIFSETIHLDKQRGLEIQHWLDTFTVRNGYTPPYIILDDNIDTILDLHKGHIVYCNPEFGLTTKEVNIAINLLNKFNRELKESRG